MVKMKLNSPITDEQWNIITDAELEHSDEIEFTTPSGKKVVYAKVTYGRWIPCDERLPNEDEIIFNGVSIKGEREISDRVLAIDLTGFIRCGYFTKAMIRHNYHGNGKRNIYSVYGEACWDFCEHYDSNPKKWIVPTPTDDIVAWMPLPKSWKGEES